MSQKLPFSGQCLCGGVQYEVAKIAAQMGHCHCTMCRKFHGAAFSTLAEAQVDDFSWIAGQAQLASYTAPNKTVRQFCSQCGSSMTFHSPHSPKGIIEFSAGTLDTPITVRPDAHIFTADKADWYALGDDLPKYPSHRHLGCPE